MEPGRTWLSQAEPGSAGQIRAARTRWSQAEPCRARQSFRKSFRQYSVLATLTITCERVVSSAELLKWILQHGSMLSHPHGIVHVPYSSVPGAQLQDPLFPVDVNPARRAHVPRVAWLVLLNLWWTGTVGRSML